MCALGLQVKVRVMKRVTSMESCGKLLGMGGNVFFDPHVGEKYGKEGSLFKKKILVLGDSHYCDNECTDRKSCGDLEKHQDCADFTQEIVKDFLNLGCTGERYRWKGTYSRFVNSMMGREASQPEREEFFDSVVFYNYMQAAAGDNPYVAGSYEHSDKRYLSALYEVLDKYSPDVVICWGQTLWDTLPDDFNYGEPVKGAGIKIGDMEFLKYYDYPYKDGRLMLIGVHHPSIGYARDFHHEIFSKLIFA